MEPERRTSRGRVWIARCVAIAADLLQIVLFPLFLPGAASPWSDALDLAVAGAMTLLLGWHWAFLPSLVAEVVPGLDLVPTWTAAAFFVTRNSGRAASARVAREGAIEAQVVASRPAGPARPPGS
jgi:hypothetical protein